MNDLIIHCEHKWSKLVNDESAIEVCSECSATISINNLVSKYPTSYDLPLTDILRIPVTDVHSRTRTAKNLIVIEEGAVVTEYFARKKVVTYAAMLFSASFQKYKPFTELTIEIPYSKGKIVAGFTIKQFCTYFKLDLARIKDKHYMLANFFENKRLKKPDVVEFTDRYATDKGHKYLGNTRLGEYLNKNK